MKLASLLVLLVAVSSTAAEAQTPAPASARLRVFLDCGDCFSEYLRDEIKWVDFVRQAQDADVHLLGSSSETGGGGREHVLRFVGAGRFKDVNQELKAVTLTGDPEDVRRKAVLQAVSVGLLNYMARTGLAADLQVSVKAAEVDEDAPPGGKDPWRAWVFELGGEGSVDAQETNREVNWQGSFSADRVTADWKVALGAEFDYSTERFDLDEDEPLKVTRRSRVLDWFVARSLGPHWSLGLDGNLRSSSFGNTKLAFTTGPAVEYSVFPYSEYASRQLLAQYQIGVYHARYNEVTLFGVVRETRPGHQMEVRFDQRQPWGSVQAGVELSQYLHDAKKYRVEANGDLSFRIIRGLSVNLEVQASRIRDQIALPLRGATPEEVLLRLRELQSGYEVSFQAGFSYSFGSLFNNVVNPRFGR